MTRDQPQPRQQAPPIPPPAIPHTYRRNTSPFALALTILLTTTLTAILVLLR